MTDSKARKTAVVHRKVDACVDAILDEVGKTVVLGLPLGLGKANHIANALFARALADPSLKLNILTALTLEKQPKEIIIIGAGGHGKVVLEILRAQKKHEPVGFLDADPSLADQTVAGLPVLGAVNLLPKLRAEGFTYFAAEALNNTDTGLMARGYPTTSSGSEYLHEPLYGDIIREAIRLGFQVVAYESDADALADREAGQAQLLYRKVFAKDPKARLFVHAGYAHIDKAPGRLGDWHPMAMQLEKLTGLVPLSIDQTDFLETGLDGSDPYHRLAHAFPSDRPEVLLNRQTGQPWSARPAAYDVNVILPATLSLEAFGKYKYGYQLNYEQAGLPHVLDYNEMQRAGWLTLDGKRRPYAIDTALCRGSIPCVVDAYYPGEPNDAIAADRYAFMGPTETSKLYLCPGSYRLRASDSDGRTLSESTIEIALPKPLH